MTNDQYVEHEVQIRLLSELTNHRFKTTDDSINRIDSKMNWIIGIFITSILMPIFWYAIKIL